MARGSRRVSLDARLVLGDLGATAQASRLTVGRTILGRWRLWLWWAPVRRDPGGLRAALGLALPEDELTRVARLYAATGDGFARLDEAGAAWAIELALSGSGAQCIAVDPADPDTVFVGLREGGVRRSVDSGQSWIDCELPEPAVFSLAVSAADGAVYAGTEPSRLFRSDDRGESWRELEALLELPSRPSWSFPPRPWTSHVHWIAPSPHDPGLLLVGIELGGLMRSTDGGQSWQDHRPGAQRDVHSLAWHPRTAGRAYEAGGGLQHGRRRDLAARRRRPRPPLHLVGHRRPRRPRLLVRLGEHRPLRRPRSPRPASAHLPAAP